MATATMVLNDMNRLFDGGTLAGRPDAQLLERFVAGGDESAFAALVSRHGPMVLATCRAVLRDAGAAEDAFQATFLVLARKAGSVRGRDALGGWLHRVAFRAAVQANRAEGRRRLEERKAAEMRASAASREGVRDDLRALIHAEVERLPEALRLPVVLCDLGGMSREQAAAELRWTEGTVRGRLARGRAKLRARLTRHGVAPTTAAIAAATAREATAAVPEAWVAATARAASAAFAGKVAAGAASTAIAAGVLRSMLVARLQVVAGGVLALVAAMTSVGLMASREATPRGPAVSKAAAPVPAATPAPPADGAIVYHGRVLGPDGRPFEGARLAIRTTAEEGPSPPPTRARSGADGRFRFEVARAEFKGFGNKNMNKEEVDAIWRDVPIVASADGLGPDWAALAGHDAAGREPGPDGGLALRLVEAGPPIAGRVLDLQGRPVAGATVRVARIERPFDGRLDAFLRAWKAAQPGAESLVWAGGTLLSPSLAGVPAEVKVDAGGRFRIAGIGTDRAARLEVSAPGIEATEVRVVTRAGLDSAELAKVGPETEMMNGKPARFGPPLYGPTFDLLLDPGRSLGGVVREAGTGRPIAGVKVSGGGQEGAQQVEAFTDDQGRYRLAGLPVAVPVRLNFYPKGGQTYLPASQVIPAREGAGPIAAEVEMTRAVTAVGRVVERETGKPVRGLIIYQPLAGNAAFQNTPSGEWVKGALNAESTALDGSFRVPVGPGPGVILVQIQAPSGRGLSPDYLPARRDPKDGIPGTTSGGEEMLFGVDNRMISLITYQAYLRIDPKPGDAEVACELKVGHGRSKEGRVLDPEGKPLAGAVVSGLGGFLDQTRALAGPGFTATLLDPARPRYLLGSHAGRKLAGARVVKGDEPGPVDLRLEPAATLSGRLIDDEGRPIAGARIGLGYRGEKDVALPGLAGRPQDERIITDGDGKFRVEGLVAGLKAVLWASKGGRPLNTGKALEVPAIRPGESKDLGDVAARPFQ